VIVDEEWPESQNFAVYSNVKFLMTIGKFSAETGQCFETGLMALTDYFTILDYFQMDVSEEAYLKLKIKA